MYSNDTMMNNDAPVLNTSLHWTVHKNYADGESLVSRATGCQAVANLCCNNGLAAVHITVLAIAKRGAKQYERKEDR